MSDKCEITIEFDRQDRVYRGGETVGGVVRVLVNKDLTCNQIKLTHFWKTHGRGNTDSGTRHEVILSDSCELRDGETLEFPFSFTAECWPLTYHGHYVNVDHYVRVDVDIPWAFDPKAEEEYLLRAGKRPPEMTGRRDEIVKFDAQKSKQASGIGKIVGFVLIAVVLVVLLVFALVLVIPLLIVGLIVWMWRKMIASRVGDVALKIPHVVVAPGEAWPVKLKFTPKKSFSINGVTLKLFAQESATSGSGTSSTTYRHTVYEDVSTLRPAGLLAAGETVDEQFTVPFPDTAAYSFEASDNKVEWSAEVRIDMPGFPDWKEKQDLQVVPSEFVDESGSPAGRPVSFAAHSDAAAEYAGASSMSGHGSGSGSVEDGAVEQPYHDRFSDAAAPAARARNAQPDIMTLIDQLEQAGRFGGERRELVRQAEGQVFDVAIDVDRVVSTFAASHGRRYQNGKTVTGTVAGTDRPVELFTLQESGRQVDDLSRGDRWRARVTVSGWDTLYDRLILLEAPPDSP